MAIAMGWREEDHGTLVVHGRKQRGRKGQTLWQAKNQTKGGWYT